MTMSWRSISRDAVRIAADLATVRSSDFVNAVVAEVERLGDDVLLVGHSMAGIAMPRVMAQVGCPPTRCGLRVVRGAA